jgi:hypothetical protein
MRFFKAGVQRVINVVVGGVVVCTFVLPVTWGYRRAREAHHWHETAWVYRLREAARRTNFLVADRYGDDPCGTLARLGLDVAPGP